MREDATGVPSSRPRALLFSMNPIRHSHKRQLLQRHARCPCITFVVAAQHVRLALNASLSRPVETVNRIS